MSLCRFHGFSPQQYTFNRNDVFVLLYLSVGVISTIGEIYLGCMKKNPSPILNRFLAAFEMTEREDSDKYNNKNFCLSECDFPAFERRYKQQAAFPAPA